MRLFSLQIISILLVSQSALIAQEAVDTIPLQDRIIVTPDTILKQVDEKLVSIVGVGDIMLGTNFPHPKYLPPQNGDNLMKELYPFISDASISFGNLEGAFSDSLPITKKCQDTANCYAFRSPDFLFKHIADAGFDVLSMANNHSGDLGVAGRLNTIELIEKTGLRHVGLLEYPTIVVERDGVKFGFCAFAPIKGTCDINDTEEAVRIIKSLNERCDVTVVSFHGGAEGSKYEHLTKKRELFLGEDRGNVYEFARKMIDAGADVILGHGPHVLRAVDLYKDRFIIYSLGNFCTYSRMKVSGINGLAPILKVFTNKKGEFKKAEVISCKQIKGLGTRIDKQNKAALKLKELTLSDLPEAKLNISAEGLITPTN
ncbi:CapA family protein [Ancylomarina euxinus]|uniref:CapA family protein n=1 Tax=Ancylomarina euxinus TaxID=2283627 RepID=A0A425Y558_9BACT|nr:CapA family protein [Ancylomarina euxinus]MCZ4694364.1 CapA family protein [Ancylomarina euxinus]MUP14305.1 CapA family protein [Ancylomarina euxinus]RRG23622.1 CapA family protein [Ancylomarina euxinus]